MALLPYRREDTLMITIYLRTQTIFKRLMKNVKVCVCVCFGGNVKESILYFNSANAKAV